MLCFDFETPLEVFSIGLMDIPPSRGDFVEVSVDGSADPTRINFDGLGNNSVQTVPIDMQDVTKVCVFLLGEGAITNLLFCAPDREPSGAPSLSPAPTNTGVPSASPSDAILGSISGNVKEDVDNNDTGDVNLVNVQIDLLDSTGAVVATRFTDSDGNYVFNDLPMGSYTVVETNLPNYVDVSDTDPPNDNMISVTLSVGGVVNSTDNDFVDELVSDAPSVSSIPSETPTVSPGPTNTGVPSASPSEGILGSISGTVLEDLDNNDTGDVGLANVTITLLDSTGTPVATTTTDSAGNFVFNDVPLGSYTLVETNLPNYVDVSDTDGPNDNMISVTLTAGAANSTGNVFVDELVSSAPSVSVTPSAQPSVPGSVLSSSPSSAPSESKLPSVLPSVSPSAFCPERALIDFETTSSGTSLEAGAYVGDDFLPGYNITVTATSVGGFTPNGQARIFDTSNPGANVDLGTPNRYDAVECLIV